LLRSRFAYNSHRPIQCSIDKPLLALAQVLRFRRIAARAAFSRRVSTGHDPHPAAHGARDPPAQDALVFSEFDDVLDMAAALALAGFATH
jgi:hypothetical protein